VLIICCTPNRLDTSVFEAVGLFSTPYRVYFVIFDAIGPFNMSYCVPFANFEAVTRAVQHTYHIYFAFSAW